MATINLPKSPTFLGNFYKSVKIYHFSSKIIVGQLLLTFGNFFWSLCSNVNCPVSVAAEAEAAAVFFELARLIDRLHEIFEVLTFQQITFAQI